MTKQEIIKALAEIDAAPTKEEKMKKLYEHGIEMVRTSNDPPDYTPEWYKETIGAYSELMDEVTLGVCTIHLETLAIDGKFYTHVDGRLQQLDNIYADDVIIKNVKTNELTKINK